MLRVHCILQTLQFAFESADASKMTLEQTWLEPAVKVLHASVVLRSGWWNEDRLDLKAQAQPDQPREIPCSGSPAQILASVIQLDLLRATERLPAIAQKVQNCLHFARTTQFQADGTIKHILADKNIVALLLPFQVNRTDQIHLMQLIGVLCLWRRIHVRRQETCQAHSRQGHTVSLQHALDGSGTRDRTKIQGFQFGLNRAGANQGIACLWMISCLQSFANGENGSFHF